MEAQRFMAKRHNILAATAVMLAAGFVSTNAHAQAGVWVFHSGARGSCPGLDWHVTRDGNNLGGFITWDHGNSMAKVKGTVSGSAFNLAAAEVGGTRTANITGRIADGNMMVAQITGVPRCEGQTISAPWFTGMPSGSG